MFCREHVAQLRDHHQAILDAGAGVAAIGTGNPEMARALQSEQGIEFPLLIDEELRSYRAVGVGQATLAKLARPALLAADLRTLRGGHRQGKIGTHPLTLGATHLIRPDGSVPFAWRNTDPADNAPLEDALATL